MAHSYQTGTDDDTSYDLDYKPRKLPFRRKSANYNLLTNELDRLGYHAEADDFRADMAFLIGRHARAQDRHTRLANRLYGTLRTSLDAYRKKEITEPQLEKIFAQARGQLHAALTPTKREKKKSPTLSDIVEQGILQKAAAILLFSIGVLFLDQVSLTGFSIVEASGYDYYSLFGFALLGISILLLLSLRKR